MCLLKSIQFAKDIDQQQYTLLIGYMPAYNYIKYEPNQVMDALGLVCDKSDNQVVVSKPESLQASNYKCTCAICPPIQDDTIAVVNGEQVYKIINYLCNCLLCTRGRTHELNKLIMGNDEIEFFKYVFQYILYVMLNLRKDDELCSHHGSIHTQDLVKYTSLHMDQIGFKDEIQLERFNVFITGNIGRFQNVIYKSGYYKFIHELDLYSIPYNGLKELVVNQEVKNELLISFNEKILNLFKNEPRSTVGGNLIGQSNFSSNTTTTNTAAPSTNTPIINNQPLANVINSSLSGTSSYILLSDTSSSLASLSNMSGSFSSSNSGLTNQTTTTTTSTSIVPNTPLANSSSAAGSNTLSSTPTSSSHFDNTTPPASTLIGSSASPTITIATKKSRPSGTTPPEYRGSNGRLSQSFIGKFGKIAKQFNAATTTSTPNNNNNNNNNDNNNNNNSTLSTTGDIQSSSTLPSSSSNTSSSSYPTPISPPQPQPPAQLIHAPLNFPYSYTPKNNINNNKPTSYTPYPTSPISPPQQQQPPHQQFIVPESSFTYVGENNPPPPPQPVKINLQPINFPPSNLPEFCPVQEVFKYCPFQDSSCSFKHHPTTDE